MSKHQSCSVCRSNFVGPDTNMGSNLCNNCNQDVHGECLAEIEQLQGNISILSDVCRHFMFEVGELQAKRLTSFKTVVVEAERVLVAVKEKQ